MAATCDSANWTIAGSRSRTTSMMAWRSAVSRPCFRFFSLQSNPLPPLRSPLSYLLFNYLLLSSRVAQEITVVEPEEKSSTRILCSCSFACKVKVSTGFLIYACHTCTVGSSRSPRGNNILAVMRPLHREYRSFMACIGERISSVRYIPHLYRLIIT